MSGTALRRNTSKQGLHNLQRLTAQRSIEDAEETERERRRRAREAARTRAGGAGPWGALRDSGPQSENRVPQSAPPCENSGPQSEDSVPQSEDRAPLNKDNALDAGLKPNCQATLEEDEGFSDWTLKLGGNRQHQQGEQSLDEGSSGDGNLLKGEPQEEEEEHNDESEMKSSEGSGELEQREREEVEEEERTDLKKRELDNWKKKEQGEQKPKVTYVSSIFLQQEKRKAISNGVAAGEEMTSCTITTKRSQRTSSMSEEVQAYTGEGEVKQISKLEEAERQRQEQLRRRQLETEAEWEQLRKKREERRRAREEDERKREEEEHQQQAQEEDSIRKTRAKIERRRTEAAEKMKKLSITDGEEPISPVSPKSPTFKNETEERVTAENTSSILERTESLNRSLKKNNGEQALPPVLISTIDDRLKQYTHALETSCREGRPTVADIPRSPEPVASKKSLFEGREAWSQSATKNQQLKDVDGLKVGVADRISHWVKGNPESHSRKSTSKPSNVKGGDVLCKRNLWESVRASSSAGAAGKGSLYGKRYTFVVTGHGKYEKLPVSGDNHD